jgi:uncharacterized YigZ family protein
MIDIKDIDKYYTIEKSVRTEIKIKGSRFISSIFSVTDQNSAEDILKNIRHEYYDATHNCFAYKIGYEGNIFRYSDDGEPSGSAGKPIYFAISKYNLSDIIVIVTRFFGGTKLGVGGLVRAYTESAEESLKIAEKKIIHRTNIFAIKCSYSDVSVIKKLIERNAVKFDEEYAEDVKFKVYIPISKTAIFPEIVFESTMGNVTAKKMNSQDLDF